MKDLLKSELKTWAQYLVLALIAGWLNFVIKISSIPGINTHEAWRIYEPMMRDWLIVFAVLGAVRLILVLIVRKIATQI